MATRQTRLIIKNNSVPSAPFSGATLLKGEAIVNTADGIMMFSGVTSSTSEWTPAGTGGNTTFFEVGSNLYDLRLRNRITRYEGQDGAGLVGKFLSGTTDGFVLADISDIADSVDSYTTGATWNPNTLTINLNNGKPSVSVDISSFTALTVNGDLFVTGTQTVNNLTITGTGLYNTVANGSNPNEIVNYSSLTAFSQTNDVYVTGSTYSAATDSNNQTTHTLLYHGVPVGGPFTLIGEDTYTTGGTYNSGATSIDFTRNDGVTYSVDLSTIDLNDTFVTGGTMAYIGPNGTLTLTRNDGDNVTITGLTDIYTTGSTLIGSTAYFDTNQSLSAYTLDLSSLDTNDTYVTGFTYSNNVATIKQNEGESDLSIVIDTMTGLTINGNLSVTGDTSLNVLSATTIYSGGTNLMTIINDSDTYVTGFTYNNANEFTVSRNQGQPNLVATINTVTGLTNTGNLDLQGQLSNSTGNVVINDNLNITGITTSFGNILPGANLTYDLGAEGQRWDELWVRRVQIGTTTTTLEEIGGNFEMSGNTGNFVFKPSSNAVFHSDVLPDIDLTRNIGSPSFRWDIFAGDITATGLTISGLGSGRVVYTNGSGGLTTESGFEYNDSTSLLTIGNINVTNPSGTTANIGQGGLVIGSGGSHSSPGIGDLTVHGSLTVFGTATTVSTNELYIEDPQITLNYNPTGNTAPTSVASGIRIQDGNGLTSGNTDVYLTIAQMNTFTGLTGTQIPDITEYTSSTGYDNRAFLTQLNDIVIRNTNLNNGAPNGVRVLAEFDILSGGEY